MSNDFGRARLSLEDLGRRDVPSATAALQGANLVITSDGAADQVLVTEAAGKIVVSINGQVQAPIARSAVAVITFNGNGGDDVFANFTNVFSIAQGGAGSDILVGGSGGNVLVGGTGNDILIGGIGNDYLIGGEGNDVLFGGAGIDVKFGGTGRDASLDNDPRDAFDDHGMDQFDAPEDEAHDVNDDHGTDAPGTDDSGHGGRGNSGHG